MKKLSLCILLLFSIIMLNAQEVFTGTIEYSISFPGMELDPMMKSYMPTSIIATYGNDALKIEQLSNAVSQTVIVKEEEKMTYILLSMMGQKFMIKQPMENTDNMLSNDSTEIEYTEETKTIQGYECKKCIISTTAEGTAVTSTCYTSSQIINPINKLSNANLGVDIIPLEYEVETAGIKMLLSAKSIKKSKVKKSEFAIPDGYKEISMEDLQNLGM
ncbi:MAG: hypothetical protein PHU62_07140 [Bacteroidales bacterium]|jgi:hypothetical protein|nr:hypothetical protein [Bacteroidales bacterium]MDD2204400.1 hypothetical protein [Bacteroidales bacterium]MDD3152356.1 hypothetical protein [Bacteroidales bacterium]MDD3913828.1 hypothetical protein [Bacteroidales bacterium]MDD4634327.1 hypothetical protein [Bacteroidales bacterium]